MAATHTFRFTPSYVTMWADANNQGGKVVFDANGNLYLAGGITSNGVSPLIPSSATPTSLTQLLAFNPSNVQPYDAFGQGANFFCQSGLTTCSGFYVWRSTAVSGYKRLTTFYSDDLSGYSFDFYPNAALPTTPASLSKSLYIDAGNVLFFPNTALSTSLARFTAGTTPSFAFDPSVAVTIPKLTASVLSVTPGVQGVAASDAVGYAQLPTLNQVHANALFGVDHPRNYVVNRHSQAYFPFGDSITVGCCAPTGDGYADLVAAALGTGYFNVSRASDQSVDTANNVIGEHGYGVSDSNLYSLMIGTNDTGSIGATGTSALGPHEALFVQTHIASLSYLATRVEDKVKASTLTCGNWSVASPAGTDYQPSLQSSTNGAVCSATITTFGGPIYVWSRIADGDGGSMTAAVDGGTPVTISSTPAAPITTSTFNGATSSYQMTALRGFSAGSHSVTFTITSASGAGNAVNLVAIGTPAKHAYYAAPTVAVGTIIPWTADQYAAVDAVYNQHIMDNVRQLERDGNDVRLVDTRTPMLNGADALYNGGGGAHPNQAGHAQLALPFIYALQRPPDSYVNRSTPPSSTSGCTPGDVWGDGGYIYDCASYGQILRTSAGASW